MEKVQRDAVDYLVEECLLVLDTFLVGDDLRRRHQIRLLLRRLIRRSLNIGKPR